MKKIKTNILFKNIMILLLGGGIAKIIGMFGKIILTRKAGIAIISLYTLITPTLMLVITLAQFSLPISISKLSAENKYNNKSLIKYGCYIGLFVDVLLIIIILLFGDKTSLMLHNKNLSIPIKLTSIILPFITISSVQRGFLHGKEDMLMPSLTQIIEEIIKIILTIFILPLFIIKGKIITVSAIILFNIFMESSSIILMHKTIKSKYISKSTRYNEYNIKKDILSISLPTTAVRLISQIGFFIEPIILTNTLIKSGYSINFITTQYGIINSYIIPLLSMPTFFSISIAAALLPNITKLYFNKLYKNFYKKLFKLLLISVIIGLICLLVIMIFPKQILNLVYGNSYGINYIYIIGPFFLILYMQPALSVSIQAMGKTNNLFITSITTLIIKYGLLLILCMNNVGILSFLIAIIIGIITNTLIMIVFIAKEKSKTI